MMENLSENATSLYEYIFEEKAGKFEVNQYL